MYGVLETEPFIRWMGSLRDRPTWVRLRRRLGKAACGNLGDVKPVGGVCRKCVGFSARTGAWSTRGKAAPSS